MKTLAHITLTSLMIIIIANSQSFGGSLNKFRMYLGENKTIEVWSKVESLVEENIPVVKHSIRSNPTTFVLQFEVKEELVVEEDLILTHTNKTTISNGQMLALIKSINKPEQEIDDLEIDTAKVFDAYQSSRGMEITPEILARFVKAENEVVEENVVSSMVGKHSK
jgi:uncharacterized protein (UPF0335 family)